MRPTHLLSCAFTSGAWCFHPIVKPLKIGLYTWKNTCQEKQNNMGWRTKKAAESTNEKQRIFQVLLPLLLPPQSLKYFFMLGSSHKWTLWKCDAEQNISLGQANAKVGWGVHSSLPLMLLGMTWTIYDFVYFLKGTTKSLLMAGVGGILARLMPKLTLSGRSFASSKLCEFILFRCWNVCQLCKTLRAAEVSNWNPSPI